MFLEKKIQLVIVIIIIIFILTVGIIIFSNIGGKGSFRGKHNILVLCTDPTEQRQGVGAVDMAFMLELNKGKLSKTTPIYPGGMYDPSLTPPADLRSEGTNQWYLHDSLWTSDLNEGVKRAKQIIKYNTNLTTDITVVVNPDAIDAMINTVGPVYSNGQEVTSDSLSFLRNNQDERGATRGDAIEGLVDGIIDATEKKGKKAELLATVLDQYGKGNILFVPKDAFQKLIAYI